MTPWEQGYELFKRGGIAALPTGDSSWSLRLVNAGWCAARRDYVKSLSKNIASAEHGGPTAPANAKGA